MKRRKWTFASIVKAAAKKAGGWNVSDRGVVRCERGLCPLGVLFYPRHKISPCATDVPVRRDIAIRVAYAADSEGSPDRRALLKGLGLR